LAQGQSNNHGCCAADFTDCNGILSAAINLDELEGIEPVYRHAQAFA
jgi:hypothetical protein